MTQQLRRGVLNGSALGGATVSKTGLGSVKVLVGKNDPRDYRGAGVKRMMVTAIECISANGRSLLPMNRLLQEEQKIIALFFSSNGFLEAGSSRSHDQLLYIGVSLRRILAAIEGK